MIMQDATNFAMDYVYNHQETNELHTMRILMEITSEKALITMLPEQEMSVSEIEQVLNGLEDDLFNKARIKITKEFDVVVSYGGKTYTVALTDNPLTVTALTVQTV